MRVKLIKDTGPFPSGYEFEFDWGRTFVGLDSNGYFFFMEDTLIYTQYLRFIESSSIEETAWLNNYICNNLGNLMLFLEVDGHLAEFPMFYNQKDAMNLHKFYKSKETALRNILYDVMLESAKESGSEIFIGKKDKAGQGIRLFDENGRDRGEPVSTATGAIVMFSAYKECEECEGSD